MSLTKAEVHEVLGPVDDIFAADIVATGASREELLRAWTWVNSEEALVSDGHELPRGRVGALVELLSAPEDDEL